MVVPQHISVGWVGQKSRLMPVVEDRTSMQDSDVQHVQQRVLRSFPNPSRQAPDQSRLQLAAQAKHIRETLRLSDVAEDSLRVVITMSVLGPTSAHIPPASLREELVDILHQLIPDEKTRLERIWDVTVAYGCGTWRELPDEAVPSHGWEQRWQAALDQLAVPVFGWLKAMAAWLHFDIQLKGYAFRTPFPRWHDAQLFASLLWAGKCDCWRLRSGDTDQPLDRRTAQRAARCLREHRLAAWNPAEMTLSNFLARAIKGDKARGNRSGKKGFVSGALEQGMAFCDLYRDCDMRFGKVLGWHCPQHPTSIFEGAECLACDEQEVLTMFSETTHQRKVVRRLLVKAPTGPYEQEEYWHCQDSDTCDTYYRVGLATCPLCDRARTAGAARSTVWVLGSFASSSEAGPQPDPTHRQDELWQAFRGLDAREQEVLQLVVVDGLSKKGVARQLELSLSELTDVYTAALQKLKQHVTEI
ncbi:MAG: RNA polymerase sigma factor [Candidatus Binatia bacterium]